MMSPLRPLLLAAATLLVTAAGCKSKSSDTPPEATSAAPSAAPPAQPPVTVTVVYGTEKRSWMEEEAKAFEASGAKTSGGRPIHIDLRTMGSGEAMDAVDSGSVKAAVFSPASSAYLSLLNDRWLSHGGHTKPVVSKSELLVLSPVVLAMWKPMAEALGWPKKSLSWADLLKVSANPKGWGAFGYAEWGKFKLGHCHPDFSNSGLLAVLAEAYAGAKKTRDLKSSDLDTKTMASFLSQVEDTIVHYGKSTGYFADKMIERGPSYLSAAVVYENLVIESYDKHPQLPLVAIYPVEGTFWADHPYAILDADWVGADERAGAEAFQAFLKAKPAQERALQLGFRPADPQIPMGPPIDVAHGVDGRQPQTVLPIPDVATIKHLIEVWRANKKGTDVVLAFDKSGSMRGKPLQEAKEGAKNFLGTLTDQDDVTLMFFDGTVYPPVGPLRLGAGRPQLLARLDGVSADGGTALYQAIAQAYDAEAARAKTSPNRIHAVVVMTDGKDEANTMSLNDLESRFPSEKDEAPVKVFTIAYGAEAEGKVLDGIAEAAKGYSAKGSLETIRSVYVDMASFF